MEDRQKKVLTDNLATKNKTQVKLMNTASIAVYIQSLSITCLWLPVPGISFVPERIIFTAGF